MCIDCIEGYYLSTQCYPCHASCKNCHGGTAKDCVSCSDGYFLDSDTNVCFKLSCLASQYVHSTYGCFNCSDSFVNAEQCTSDGPSSCSNGNMLINGSCITCSKVSGYTIVNGECSEVCGDGIVINDLCDDGNILNGDGCSSYCSV